MPLPKLRLDPDESAYSVKLGEQVASVTVSQGPSRRRRANLGAVSVVSVQWVLDSTQYQYLTAFRRTTLIDGTLPFLMDMILDDADLAEYRCAFVVDSYELSGKRGSAYVVRAQLEVRPNVYDAAFDASVVDVYDAYGLEASDVLNQLAILVNIQLPNELS